MLEKTYQIVEAISCWLVEELCFLGFLGNCKFLGFIQSIKKKKKNLLWNFQRSFLEKYINMQPGKYA